MGGAISRSIQRSATSIRTLFVWSIVLANLGNRTPAIFEKIRAHLSERIRNVGGRNLCITTNPFIFYGYGICRGVLFTLDVWGVRGARNTCEQKTIVPGPSVRWWKFGYRIIRLLRIWGLVWSPGFCPQFLLFNGQPVVLKLVFSGGGGGGGGGGPCSRAIV